LLIALSSWLILNQINPKIFVNDLSLNGDLIKGAGQLNTGVPGIATNVSGPTNSNGGSSNFLGGASSKIIGDEASIRSTLSQKGISINKTPCTYSGQKNCTDTFGMRNSTLDTLVAMKNNSGAKNLTLTGGTEGGGIHNDNGVYTHVNGYKVDVAPGNAQFDTYMKSLGSSTTVNGNKVNILNEGDHWDIQVVPPSSGTTK
jgi:hypothetical protein